MINELDRVALTKALPEYGLVPGDVGTVVLVHKGGEGFTLEFMTLGGETLAIATVRKDAVRPLRSREITHVREVA
jgi:Domain of unknown function (DUF4926)